MATKLSTLSRACNKLQLSATPISRSSISLVQKRCVGAQKTISIPGPIPPAPQVNTYSKVVAAICICAGMFGGAMAAQKFAAVLEQNEIFVPEDDDD